MKIGNDNILGPISPQFYNKLTLRDEVDLYWFLSRSLWNNLLVLDLRDYGKPLYPLPIPL